MFISNGDGTFKASVSSTITNADLRIPALGDFNGDGNLDLVGDYMSGDSYHIALGNGDGTFQTPINYAVGEAPWFVSSSDFNADGHNDIAATNVETAEFIFNGTSDQTISSASSPVPGTSTFGILTIDNPGTVTIETDSDGDDNYDIDEAILDSRGNIILDAEGNQIFTAGTTLNKDDVWSATIPVYKDKDGVDCVNTGNNPNGDTEIVGFANIKVLKPAPPPATEIYVKIDCEFTVG